MKVTDAFDITKSVIPVTRDNASVNDTLLTDFQWIAEKQWEEMNDEKKAQYPLQFKRHEGDIGCVSHIYNLGVVAGSHITKRSTLNYTYKADSKEHRHEYEHKQDNAALPAEENSTSTRSVLAFH